MTSEKISVEWNTADVDVVLALNPAFKEALTIAAVARMRAENTQRIAEEAQDATTADDAGK